MIVMPEKFWESPGVTLFISGFISILGMVAVLRELAVAFHGIELIYPAAIGGWLFFAAIGTLFGKSLSRQRTIAFLLTLFSLLILSIALFIRGSAPLLDKTGLFSNTPFRQTSLFIVALLPGGLISGLVFGDCSFRHLARNGTAEGAYGMEAAGGMTGALLASAAFQYGFSNLHLAFFCALIASAAATLFFMNKRGGAGRLIAATVIVLTIALLCKAPQLDMRMTAWSHPGLFFSGDFPAGRIAATYNSGSVSVFENGGIAFSTQDNGGALFAHLSALQHPEPLRILEIGGGWGGSVGELLLHKPVRIDVMLPEGDPYIRYRLPPEIRRSLANPIVHLFHDDPRKFLKRKGFAWDLIIIDVSLPQSCRKNVYYTREFFSSLSRRLRKGGVVALRLPPIKDPDKKRDLIIVKNIDRKLAAVFPERLIIPGTTTMLAASFTPFHDSTEILTDRLHERAIKSSHISPEILKKLFTGSNCSNIREKLHAATPEEKYAIRPTCYTYAATSFAAELLPATLLSLTPDFDTMQEKSVMAGAIIAIGLFLLFFASRLHPNWEKTVLTAAGGFLGTANLCLILLYHSLKEGSFYQDIPFLLVFFLAGLSLGAPLFLDFTTKLSTQGNPERRARFWGAVFLVGFMFINAGIIRVTQKDIDSPTLAAFLSAITGFLASGLFFRANAYRVGGLKKSDALYMATLIGGSLGALCAGIFLIPVLGFAPTSMALMIFAALTLIVV